MFPDVTCRQEQEQLAMKSNMKRLEEENSRHLKTINSLKVQMKKHERMSGESRNKTVDLETELSQLKKVSGVWLPKHPLGGSTAPQGSTVGGDVFCEGKLRF